MFGYEIDVKNMYVISQSARPTRKINTFPSIFEYQLKSESNLHIIGTRCGTASSNYLYQILGCNNGGGGEIFSKVKRLVA